MSFPGPCCQYSVHPASLIYVFSAECTHCRGISLLFGKVQLTEE